MTPSSRPPGRPRRTTVNCAWPSLKQLSTELADARGPVRLADFAEVTHYSIAALSDATSGKRIPTEQFLQAYAKAAAELNGGNEWELLTRWTALREAAAKERNASETSMLPVGSSGSGATGILNGHVQVNASGEVVPSPESVTLGPTETAKLWIAKRREASVPEQDPARGGDAGSEEEKVPRRLVSLVSQAVEAEKVANRDNVAVHVDPVLGALALGSTSKDVKMLLRDRLNRAGVSFRDLATDLNKNGIRVSKSTLERRLTDDEPLPPALLGAMLHSCGASRAEVSVWLYHRARIEIASVVRHVDTEPDVDANGGLLEKLRTERVTNWMQLGMVCATALVILLQILSR
ncbi:hypothetical protein [Streptomyces sp. NPDC046939]|uniref:hypothetical protein n=1 Tax=Streptomyces sp. NPDC046939 TaxID=3155376 RepID=UPI0033EED0EB